MYVNKHSDLMFWHIGHYINEDMGYKQYSAYGSRILATLSQKLTASAEALIIELQNGVRRIFRSATETFSVRLRKDSPKRYGKFF